MATASSFGFPRAATRCRIRCNTASRHFISFLNHYWIIRTKSLRRTKLMMQCCHWPVSVVVCFFFLFLMFVYVCLLSLCRLPSLPSLPKITYFWTRQSRSRYSNSQGYCFFFLFFFSSFAFFGNKIHRIILVSDTSAMTMAICSPKHQLTVWCALCTVRCGHINAHIGQLTFELCVFGRPKFTSRSLSKHTHTHTRY